MKLKDEIELLFNYFDKIRLSIINVKFEESDEISKSILLCSLMDTLSRCIYPKLSNRDRFVFFVDDFSGWENKNKISLVQLYYFLKDEEDKNYEPIKSYVKNKVSKIRRGVIYKTDFDEFLHELKYLKVIETQIQKFSYANLFYKFRNYLVHEYRTPGLGSNFSKSKDIHYYLLTHISDKPTYTTMELIFPAFYLSNLVKNSIDNLKKYCLEINYNPYESFKYSTLWLDKAEIKKK